MSMTQRDLANAIRMPYQRINLAKEKVTFS